MRARHGAETRPDPIFSWYRPSAAGGGMCGRSVRFVGVVGDVTSAIGSRTPLGQGPVAGGKRAWNCVDPVPASDHNRLRWRLCRRPVLLSWFSITFCRRAGRVLAMLSTRRLSLGLLAAAGLVWAGWSIRTTQPQPAAGPQKVSVQSQVQSPAGLLLAGRYHLRNRTSRFYQRAAGPAGRGAARPRVYRRRLGRRTAEVGRPDIELLAGRYHLRGRTGRFFGRSAV